MAPCQIPGHADSYGLGIRVAFYLQWLGMIVTCWFLESDALNLKFLNGLTILATSIGLALNLAVLQPAEIYVVLLLVCGTLYYLVPVYLWRLLTCCQPWWDTELWNRIRMGWLFRTAMALLFGTLLGMQIWFWSTGVYVRPKGTDTSCQQYGFFFGQMVLDGSVLTALNLTIHIVMLVVGLCLFCDWVGIFDGCRYWRRRNRRRWSVTQNRIKSLQQFRTTLDVIVAAVIIMAIELVVVWNNISAVNTLDSAAQLLPPIISGAYFLRSLYVWMSGPADGGGDDDDNTDPRDGEFPLFGDGGSGDGGSYIYTISDRAPGHHHRRGAATRPAYDVGATNDWMGSGPRNDRHRTHHHHHRHRRHRRHAGGGEPVMSTAYRRATVVDEAAAPQAPPPVVEQPEPVHENA